MVSLEKPIHYKYFFEGRNKSCCWEASKLAGKQFKANVSRLWSDSMFCACALPADFCLYLLLFAKKFMVGKPKADMMAVKPDAWVGSHIELGCTPGPSSSTQRWPQPPV